MNSSIPPWSGSAYPRTESYPRAGGANCVDERLKDLKECRRVVIASHDHDWSNLTERRQCADPSLNVSFGRTAGMPDVARVQDEVGLKVDRDVIDLSEEALMVGSTRVAHRLHAKVPVTGV